jgi:hypothetical protein
MGNRLELHTSLLQFIPNVYFQPPSNIQMVYPCIVYNKFDKLNKFGNDASYSSKQGYRLIVIERDPDSDVADNIEGFFQYCLIGQYYTVDNLHHTTIELYY